MYHPLWHNRFVQPVWRWSEKSRRSTDGTIGAGICRSHRIPMSNSSPVPDGSIGGQILRYLDLHPGASDTVDGIAAWWLRRDTDCSIEVVQVALDELEQAGLVVVNRSQSGRIYYGRTSSGSRVKDS